MRLRDEHNALVNQCAELFQALQCVAGRLSQVMENHPGLHDPHDSSPESHEWTEGDGISLAAARAAIAKAQGKASI